MTSQSASCPVNAEAADATRLLTEARRAGGLLLNATALPGIHRHAGQIKLCPRTSMERSRSHFTEFEARCGFPA